MHFGHQGHSNRVWWPVLSHWYLPNCLTQMCILLGPPQLLTAPAFPPKYFFSFACKESLLCSMTVTHLCFKLRHSKRRYLGQGTSQTSRNVWASTFPSAQPYFGNSCSNCSRWFTASMQQNSIKEWNHRETLSSYLTVVKAWKKKQLIEIEDLPIKNVLQ